MEQLLSDSELIVALQKFDKADRLLLEIWDCPYNKAQIVVTAMKGDLPKFGEFNAVRVCEFNMELETPLAIKTEGYRLKKLLTKHFRLCKVKSNFHY